MSRSEKEFIARIREANGRVDDRVMVPIGDDCAVIRRGNGLLELLTIDTLVENIHFDRSWHEPVLLGRKSAAVNISDIAAMGGAPLYCLLSVALPAEFDENWADSFLSGFREMIRAHGVCLVGGDTVRSVNGLTISVTMVGEVAEDELLLRSTARAGDLVMVSGCLGEAAAGLEICRRGAVDLSGPWRELLLAHLDPSPEVELARVLAASGMVSAMMDISDGLATDLAHICTESDLAAEVVGNSVPVSAKLREVAGLFDLEPLELALGGGEDYRLLFTVSEKDVSELKELVRRAIGREIHQVGTLQAGSGVTLVNGSERRDISYRGYDHFA